MDFRCTMQQISKKRPRKQFTLDLINLAEEKETKLWDKYDSIYNNNLLSIYCNIELNSDEGNSIRSLINKDANDIVDVDKIYRIQNPYLMSAFLLKKLELINEYGLQSVHSRVLLRATNMQNVTKISENNFNFRNLSNSTFGGVSFATNAKYSLGSSPQNNVIIISNVLVCKTCEGRKNMVIPKSNCDTSLFKDNNINVVVKYDDNTVYPAYVVYLRKEKVISKKNTSKKQTPPNKTFVIGLINIQNQIETKSWNMAMDLRQVTHLYPLKLKSKEAKDIVSLILRHTTSSKIEITEIERIQNPYLMASYLLKKNQLMKEYGQNMVQSQQMLHGTKRKYVESILSNNFSLGFSKRTLFGKGIYFGTDIAYVQHFCDYKNKCLILCNVLVSKICEGFENMNVPYKGCDTSTSIHNNKDVVYVKYDDDTFYPAYKVNFNFRY